MSSHSLLERSADALFQQKALQTSHHERLAAEVQTSMRSIRHSYQQTREAVADVKRLQEDLRDVQEETSQLETALHSQHQLRLSMLSALRIKAMEEAAATTETLENAPMRWTGIPGRIVKLCGDLEEYEAFEGCLGETREAVLVSKSTAATATRVHALATLVTDLTRINASLHQSLIPTIAQAEAAAGAAIESLSADHDGLRRSAAAAEAQCYADASALQVLQAEVEAITTQAASLDEALTSMAATEVQLSDAQQVADGQLQSLRHASGVHKSLLQPLLDAFADEMMQLTKASLGSILPDSEARKAALNVAREAMQTDQAHLQDNIARLTQLETETSAMLYRQEALSAVLMMTAREWNALLDHAATLRASKHTLLAEQARLTADNMRLSQGIETIQAQRSAQLAVVQAAMTRLIMDAMPQGRDRVVALEDSARQELVDAQLQDLSCAIERSAARAHREEAAAAAAQRQATMASQRQHANNDSSANVSACNGIETGMGRPTVVHRLHQQSSSSQAVPVSSQPTAAPMRRPLLRRPLPRGASPAMSAWSADGHPAPHGGNGTVGQKAVVASVSGNGGAAKGLAMETPSPLPRAPQRRALAPHTYAKVPPNTHAAPITKGTPSSQQQQQQHGSQQSSLAAALRRPTKNSLFDLTRGKPFVDKGNEATATGDASGGDEFDVFAL